MIVEKKRTCEIYFNPFILLVNNKLWPGAMIGFLIFNALSIASCHSDVRENAQRIGIIRDFSIKHYGTFR